MKIILLCTIIYSTVCSIYSDIQLSNNHTQVYKSQWIYIYIFESKLSLIETLVSTQSEEESYIKFSIHFSKHTKSMKNQDHFSTWIPSNPVSNSMAVKMADKMSGFPRFSQLPNMFET